MIKNIIFFEKNINRMLKIKHYKKRKKNRKIEKKRKLNIKAKPHKKK
jgi:hypothetical protein